MLRPYRIEFFDRANNFCAMNAFDMDDAKRGCESLQSTTSGCRVLAVEHMPTRKRFLFCNGELVAR